MTRRTLTIVHSLLEVAENSPITSSGDLADAALSLIAQRSPGDLRHVPTLIRRELQKKGEPPFASLTLPSRDVEEKHWGKDVVLEQRVDPELLGGGIVQVGDDRYDGSLRRALLNIDATLRSPVTV